MGGVVSSRSYGPAAGESDRANLAGGVYQLLQLMMDLASIELLQWLTAPEYWGQAIRIECQNRFAGVLAEQVLRCGLCAGGGFQAGKHQQVVGRVFGQVVGLLADLQAGDALFLCWHGEREGKKQLVEGGVIKRVHRGLQIGDGAIRAAHR